MINKLDDAVFSNYHVVFVNEDFGNVTIYSDEMGVLSVDFNNISLDDVNFDEGDPETIKYAILMAWCNRFKQSKALKKYKQRINACSMVSYKMVGLVHARR